MMRSFLSSILGEILATIIARSRTAGKIYSDGSIYFDDGSRNKVQTETDEATSMLSVFDV
jgi:hypothetical protein